MKTDAHPPRTECIQLVNLVSLRQILGWRPLVLNTEVLIAIFFIVGFVQVDASRAAPATCQILPSHPLPTFQRLGLFQAEVDFQVGVGKADSGTVFALWQDHSPGYMLESLELSGGRGVTLPAGLYRWSFRVRRGSEPIQFPGSPIFRLSIWDVTSGEMLVERTLHSSDFDDADVYYTRPLIHSTIGRENHRFEPRVYWESFVDGWVDSVALDLVTGYPLDDLEQKALLLDDRIQRIFLDPIPFRAGNGLLVARSRQDLRPGFGSEERGDAATWMAYYVASQAFRLMARPDDAQALENMERGFWTLHSLHQVTGQPGVMARYADEAGNWHYQDPTNHLWHAGRITGTNPDGTVRLEQWSDAVISEDATTSFAFAVGVGYNQIRDDELKRMIADDIRAVAHHFLTNDYGISTEGVRVDLNPYLGIDEEKLNALIAEVLDPNQGRVESLLRAYGEFSKARSKYNELADLSDLLEALTFGCLPEFPSIPTPFISGEFEIVEALRNRDADRLKRLLPAAVPELYSRIFWLRDFLRREVDAARDAFHCLERFRIKSPGFRSRKILEFADHIISSLDELLAKLPASVQGLEDIKFHISHAIAATHVLSVARSVWPNEFAAAYNDGLYGPKQLLRTMETWSGVDETWAAFIGGDMGADRQRSAVRHRSFAALFNLIRLETSEEVRSVYQRLLDTSWSASADEGNAFADTIRASTDAKQPGSAPTDLGRTWWGLTLIPTLKTGLSLESWRTLHDEFAEIAGALIGWNDADAKGRTRDPLPVNFHAGQMFAWQRNQRDFGYDGHAERTLFPGIDYLLPYWMARANGLNPASLPDPKATSATRVQPAELLQTSGEVGLSIGRGSGFHEECKDKSGFLVMPSVHGMLPGPHGPVQVERDGLKIGYVHIRMLKADNEWSLVVDPRPEGIYWNCRVCRDGGIEKPGSEIKFIIEIIKPARPVDPSYRVICPAVVVASSGEQGVSLGSGLRHNSKDLHVHVVMPPEYQPIGGQMGRIDLSGLGYEDDYVRIRIGDFHRVSYFYMIKSPDGVQVEAQIRRPGGFDGGARIKIVVELLKPAQVCSLTMGDLPALLSFTCVEGQEAPMQMVRLEVPSPRPIYSFVTADTENSLPWIYVSPTGEFTPYNFRVRPSAANLRAKSIPYRGTLRIDMPGVVNSPQFVPVELTVVSNATPLNQPPVIAARFLPSVVLSPEQTNIVVISPNNTDAVVVFDASFSSDTEHAPLQYFWLQHGVPTPFATGPIVTNLLRLGSYGIDLAVCDEGSDLAIQTFSIDVITAAEGAASIVLQVMGLNLSHGNRQALLASLDAAMRSFEKGHFTPGINQLEAFQRKVMVQLMRTQPSRAQQLISAAQGIIESIEH